MFQMTKSPKEAPDTPLKIEIVFNNGLPIRCTELLSGKQTEQPLHILQYLNFIGGAHGIGRIDVVENRFVGMKSRGVYETPGGTILYLAHLDLEVFCLDREVWRIKNYLAEKMADYVYNGFWFSPEAEYVKNCLIESQRNVTGRVSLEIYKGNCTVIGRGSIKSLYNQELSSMNVHGALDPQSATGFIEINSMRLKEYRRAYGNTPNDVNLKALTRGLSHMRFD
jgi:argininosuccinate synthase